MKNPFDYIFQKIDEFRKIKPKSGVAYSLKKYRDTYKLLEEYDKKAAHDPQALVDPGRLKEFIRHLQRANGRKRAHSTVRDTVSGKT